MSGSSPTGGLLVECIIVVIYCCIAMLRIECGPECKSRKRDLDGEVRTLRREMRDKQDSIIRLESELLSLRQYKEAHNAEVG